MVNTIKNTIDQGLIQKRACEIFGISARKFRRWANPKPLRPRTAWNKILPQESEAIINTATEEQFLDKPLSHIYVHGHKSEKFYVSLSTVYRVLKKEDLVRKITRPRKTPYVSVHSLLKEGFSLLCYDATRFITESGCEVWSIPVMVLPSRFLIKIGHALKGVSASDLVKTVKEALALIPESTTTNLIAHSDRGSAMKASFTKKVVKELLGAPVHLGRPHTPDDQAWIEAFIKTLKYHREVPQSFKQVDDVVQWLNRFPDIYNNEPHSALKYVTPAQALSGQMEVILQKRKRNLAVAQLLRHTEWKAAKKAANPVRKKEIKV